MGSRDWRETWEVVQELPAGGQGYAHRVRRRGTADHATYVLKTLKDQKRAERRARLYAEAAALRTLDHPRVARLVDTNSELYDDQSVSLYIVTEYIDGKPMSQLDVPVSVDDACASLDVILDT